MNPTFRIFPTRNLVFVRYSGTAMLSDSARSFGAYAAHPDFVLGQNQLVDLSNVTGFENDYARLLDLQLRKAPAFMTPGKQTLMVYYAPNDIALRLANHIVRSWESVPGTNTHIVSTSEADALKLMGERETRFADLLESRETT